jgi:hypothetical protein
MKEHQHFFLEHGNDKMYTITNDSCHASPLDAYLGGFFVLRGVR